MVHSGTLICTFFNSIAAVEWYSHRNFPFFFFFNANEMTLFPFFCFLFCFVFILFVHTQFICFKILFMLEKPRIIYRMPHRSSFQPNGYSGIRVEAVFKHVTASMNLSCTLILYILVYISKRARTGPTEKMLMHFYTSEWTSSIIFIYDSHAIESEF